MNKQFNKPIAQDDSDIDITPMLDVVFIMLIFFIVTASFVNESGIELNVPAKSEQSAPTVLPIVVTVTKLQEIKIQGRVVDSRAVEPTIIRLKAESPEASVVVRVETQAKTKMIVKAVDGIRAAKVDMPVVSLVHS